MMWVRICALHVKPSVYGTALPLVSLTRSHPRHTYERLPIPPPHPIFEHRNRRPYISGRLINVQYVRDIP